MDRMSTNLRSPSERIQSNSDIHPAVAQHLHDRLTHIGHKTGGTVMFLKHAEGG